jgi:hypothetical protein
MSAMMLDATSSAVHLCSAAAAVLLLVVSSFSIAFRVLSTAAAQHCMFQLTALTDFRLQSETTTTLNCAKDSNIYSNQLI